MISVIMSVYNERMNDLKKSIDSILNQTYKKIEFIIIIDNPKNLEAIKYVKSCASNDDRVKVLINEKNIGLGRSLNKGIKLAKFDLIARMDADDISEPERFLEQISAFDDSTDALFTRFRYIDDEDNIIRTAPIVPEDKSSIASLIPRKNIIAHSSVLFRKKTLEKIGGYSDLSVLEDLELWLRMINCGYQIKGINKILLNVRLRTKSMTSSNYFKSYAAGKYIRKKYKEGNWKEINNNNFSEFYHQQKGEKNFNLAAARYYGVLNNSEINRAIKYRTIIKCLIIEPKLIKVTWNTILTNYKRKLKFK